MGSEVRTTGDARGSVALDHLRSGAHPVSILEDEHEMREHPPELRGKRVWVEDTQSAVELGLEWQAGDGVRVQGVHGEALYVDSDLDLPCSASYSHSLAAWE